MHGAGRDARRHPANERWGGAFDRAHRAWSHTGVTTIGSKQPPKTAHAHYDITAFERRRALTLGAVACSRDEIVVVLRRLKQARA